MVKAIKNSVITPDQYLSTILLVTVEDEAMASNSGLWYAILSKYLNFSLHFHGYCGLMTLQCCDIVKLYGGNLLVRILLASFTNMFYYLV